MDGSPVLSVVTGLVFVFAVTAAIASVITETISWLLALRAKFLLEGIKSLVDGDDSTGVINFKVVHDNYLAFCQVLHPGSTPTSPSSTTANASSTPPNGASTPTNATSTPTGALLGGPILGNLGLAKPLRDIQDKATGKVVPGASTLRQYPSYFSSRAFSAALLDLLLPDAPTSTTTPIVSEIRSSVLKIENRALKESLLGILKSTEEDLGKFRRGIEEWYDDHMDRVSGWYKRRVSWITFFAGAALVILLNVNAIAIARTLYLDADTRTAVAAIVNSTPCQENDETCIDKLTSETTALTAAGLPLGWRSLPANCPMSKPECTSWAAYNNIPDSTKDLPVVVAETLLLLAGWAITIVALIPGARFWYDLLARIGGLRKGSPSYAGPKPPQST